MALRARRIACLVILLGLVASVASAQITIRLTREFIEEHKNTVTIASTFTVDRAHAAPNSPSKDGDLHVAGRAPEIKLPTVAEIMNAKDHLDAVGAIHDAEGTGTPIPITGAWRIWAEHAGSTDQIQGAALQPFTTTNPDHVFEIHPISEVNHIDTLPSLKPIVGYKYKDADQAFSVYEQVRLELQVAPTTVTLNTSGAGYNYVKFILELEEAPSFFVDDGLFVLASVYNLDGEMIARHRRMVLLKGSAPYETIRLKAKGDQVTVVGVPRLNMAVLSWRIRNAGARPEVLRWNLPYEIIVVAVEPE
jgi:hypothetical protein